jgi:tripartite-type tricarboxylate transporter receptor subunit TctC
MKKQFLVTAFTVLAGIAPAVADGYPAKPITFVVPFAAGGPLDTLARTISEPMSTTLGQPIIIENVAGAAGSVGVGRTARFTRCRTICSVTLRR